MELERAIRARRMVRSFLPTPVPRCDVDILCDLARRAPSAGNTQAVSFIVLDTPADVARYWDVTLPSPRRESFGWPGLLIAPVLVMVAVDPQAYLSRYSLADKQSTGLGGGEDRWSVPYWWVDAGAVAQNLLLAAVDRNLGACLFGLFDHEPAVAETFGVPPGVRLAVTVAIGHPDDDDDRPGRSAGRTRPPLSDVVHRGLWDGDKGASSK